MIFSRSCEYAIRAMIFVAQKSNEESRVGIKEIATGTGTPEHFMAKIMQELSRKRLIHSIKGPHGGFFMDQEDLKTSIAEIVLAIDGNAVYSDCVLGLKSCSEVNPCPVHYEYKDVKTKLIAMLEKNTIGDFKMKLDSGQYFLKNMV